MFGEDGFRVKLHTLDVKFGVAHAHDLAILGPSRDLKTSWTRGPINGQRVIAVDRELLGQASEYTLLCGADDTGFAMHQCLRPNDGAAKRRANGAVTSSS